MNNITYNIIENNDMYKNDNNINENMESNMESNMKSNMESNMESNMKSNMKSNMESNSQHLINTNEKIARELDYDLNYNIKNLTLLLDIYGIKKNKLNKSQIIEKIVDFEMDINNIYIVEKNKRLYNNLLELKNNSSFSKYILI
jgi:hypothetical protein